MGKMVNVSGDPVTVKIAGMPGSRIQVLTVPAGEVCEVADGYSVPVRSAGREHLPPILSRETMRAGVAALVPLEQEAQGRRRWAAVHGKAAPAQAAAPVEPDADDAPTGELDSVADATTPKVKRKRKRGQA